MCLSGPAQRWPVQPTTHHITHHDLTLPTQHSTPHRSIPSQHHTTLHHTTPPNPTLPRQRHSTLAHSEPLSHHIPISSDPIRSDPIRSDLIRSDLIRYDSILPPPTYPIPSHPIPFHHTSPRPTPGRASARAWKPERASRIYLHRTTGPFCTFPLRTILSRHAAGAHVAEVASSK